MVQVASLYGVLNLRDNMTPGLNTALGNARSFGSSLQTIGSQVTSFGQNLTAITAPIGAGLAASLAQSNTFSRSMSNVNSILGISGQEAAALRAQLLAYGGDTVAGPQAVADAYYQIVSGVADASTHMAILDAATRTSEAGQADLTATTAALISTMNSYRFGAEDASYISDIFTRTVQTGVLSMEDMAGAFPQVTGLASSMGLDVADLAGQLSYMTTQGFSASNSATFLRSMMTTLLNPTTALGTAINEMGYSSGQAMVDALGLVGAYDAIRQYGGGAFDGLITNQEALQGALALTGQGANQFLTDFSQGITGATAAAQEIQNETAGWEQFTSQLQRLAITVGDTLAPTLLNLLNNNIIPLVNRVSEWIAQNPQLASTIAMVTGALVIAGPIIMFVGGVIAAIGGIVSGVTAVIGFLTPVVTGAAAAFTLAGGGVTGLGAAVYAVLGPFGIMIGAVALLVAWMNSREGGLIGSLNDARTSALMLAAIGLSAINRAATTARQMITLLVANLQSAVTTAQQLRDIATLGTASALNTASTTAQQLGTLIANPGATLNAIINGGQRASGGPVTAGRQYLVGEQGPELFTPSTSGNISSNRDTQTAMAGAGGDTFNIGTIVANDPEDFMRQLQERRRRRN